jgi:hypothetical protein
MFLRKVLRCSMGVVRRRKILLGQEQDHSKVAVLTFVVFTGIQRFSEINWIRVEDDR